MVFIVIFMLFYISLVSSTNKRPRKYVDLEDDELYRTLSSLSLQDSLHEYFNHGLPSSYDDSDSITVILTQYKRNHSEKQLNAILSQQRVRITQIYITQDENHVDLAFLDDIIDNIRKNHGNYAHIPPIKRLHNRDANFKYYGRFTLPLLVDTKFTAIFDDDIISGVNFLALCLEVIQEHNSLCGHAGQVLTPSGYLYVTPPFDRPVEVDYIMQTWIFRTEWIRFYWSDMMVTFSQAEDISFSMTLFKNAGIRSILAPQPAQDLTLWGVLPAYDHLGGDEHATHQKRSSTMFRWAITMYWIEAGYIPLTVRPILHETPVPGRVFNPIKSMQQSGILPSEEEYRRNHSMGVDIARTFIAVSPSESGKKQFSAVIDT